MPLNIKYYFTYIHPLCAKVYSSIVSIEGDMVLVPKKTVKTAKLRISPQMASLIAIAPLLVH